MFQKYTEKARRAIFFARYEASTYGARYIEVTHLLLGLAREVPQVLTSISGLDRATLVRDFESLCTRSTEKVPTTADLPLSPGCKQALNYAAEEAGSMEHGHVGTEHMLIGILREDGVAARALEKIGVTLDAAREFVSRTEAPAPPRKVPAEAVPPLTRQQVAALVEKVPEERLTATAGLLQALAAEFFSAIWVSPLGRFTYSAGNNPQAEPSKTKL